MDRLLAVVVRAAVISVPGIIRVIKRCVVSIIFRLGRAKPVIRIVDIGTADQQGCKGERPDQPKDRYEVPPVFPFSCHAFGALI